MEVVEVPLLKIAGPLEAIEWFVENGHEDVGSSAPFGLPCEDVVQRFNFSTHQLYPPQVMALAINDTESLQALFRPVPRVQREIFLLEEIEAQLSAIQHFLEDRHTTQGCRSIDVMQFQLRNESDMSREKWGPCVHESHDMNDT